MNPIDLAITYLQDLTDRVAAGDPSAGTACICIVATLTVLGAMAAMAPAALVMLVGRLI